MLKKWSINDLVDWERMDTGMKTGKMPFEYFLLYLLLTLSLMLSSLSLSLQLFKDEWHMLFSDELPQITHYLSHMKSIINGESRGSNCSI